MLGKLLKYELKATARFFLPLYLVLLVLTPLARIFQHLNNDFEGILKVIPVIIMVIYVIALLAAAYSSFILLIVRFYKNTITEEGYLMHTLPISKHGFIFSKGIIALFWMIISFIVVILSGIGFFITPSIAEQVTTDFPKLITAFEAQTGFNFYGFALFTIVLLVLSLINSILYFYCSIAIGQTLSKNKVLGCVVGAILVSIVSSFLGQIISIPISIAMTKLDPENLTVIINTVYPLAALSAVIMSVIYYIITVFMLEKKLNLE